MKYVAVMIGEHKLIFDIVLATLSKDQEQRKLEQKCSTSDKSSDTDINGRVKLNLEENKTGLAGLQRLACVPLHLPGEQLDCP